MAVFIFRCELPYIADMAIREARPSSLFTIGYELAASRALFGTFNDAKVEVVRCARGCTKGKDTIKTRYPPKALDDWADRLQAWASGGIPEDLPYIDTAHATKSQPRDVFARDVFARDVFSYVIHEGKVRAPAAAMALIERLTG